MIQMFSFCTFVGGSLMWLFNWKSKDKLERLMGSLGASLLVFSLIVAHIWWFDLLKIY